MKTLSLSEVINALQNAQKEGIQTVCIYSSQTDCGFSVRATAISNNGDMVLFLDTTKKIDLGSEISVEDC